MIEIQPPQTIPSAGCRVFLAGSIEMGAAMQWQQRVIKALQDTDYVILNPRRANWDNNWEQRIDNSSFREQVEWELDGLEKSERVLLYLDPATKSPVSLLELGLFATSRKLLVVCPDGFWRKGNVDIVCQRYGVSQVESLDDAINLLKEEKR